MREFIGIIAACLLAAGSVQAQIKVIDGDSLFIGTREIRLSGIDAPEYHQECYDTEGKNYACGLQSIEELKAMVGSDFECKTITTDRYHRDVADCYSDGENINRKMVAEGWAVAYDRYTGVYKLAEESARAGRRGIWAGRFMKPELYRVLHRDKKAKKSSGRARKPEN